MNKRLKYNQYLVNYESSQNMMAPLYEQYREINS